MKNILILFVLSLELKVVGQVKDYELYSCIKQYYVAIKTLNIYNNTLKVIN